MVVLPNYMAAQTEANCQADVKVTQKKNVQLQNSVRKSKNLSDSYSRTELSTERR
jgi:uncharacterized protein YlxW (UPF0749 family)